MANTDLAIRIATVLDAAGLRKADKGIVGLEKRAKSLGKSLGLALSTTAVIAFGKAAAKAFMEDEKAAALLANTVDNLGLAFANPQIATFIDQLSKAAGVADDELRPAFQALITTTGSVAKSQELLQRAIDISRGSGVDLNTVISDLTKAYTGQTKGLEKYKTGLTKAELQAMTFEQIMDKLNGQFSGSSAEYLKTYAGKMSLLNVAAGEAKETIGKGLIDALMEISGNTDIQGLIADIDSFAQGLADTLVYIGKLLYPIIEGWRIIFKYLGDSQAGAAFGQSAADQFKKSLADDKALYPKPGDNAVTGYKMTPEQKANAKAIAAAEKAAAARAKYLADQTKKNTAELKKQNALKKANTMFDLEQIGIIAALKGNISEEERLRLKLQLAIITENDTEASKLTRQLAAAQGLTKELTDWLADVPTANNPFAAWKGYLDAIELQAIRIASLGGTSVGAGVPATNGLDFGGNVIGSPVPNFTPSSSGSGGAIPPVVVQIDGKTIASALMDQSLSGNQAYVNRRTGGFE